jgi:hypothetical protein
VTVLIQHARTGIFSISGPGVTIQDMSLDTCTYNTMLPPAAQEAYPDPGVLYSTGNSTTVANVVGCAGNAYTMRFAGPNPCYNDVTFGTVVANVEVSNVGVGGYAALDVACQRGVSLRNIGIHGNRLSLYRDSATTLTGERYTPGPYNQRCDPAWYVTGPASNIAIDGVTSYGGAGHIAGVSSNVTVSNQVVLSSGCHP